MDAFFDKIGWAPGIGDPSFMGWFTVFAYFVCCYKSFRVVQFSDRIFNPPEQRQKLLWLGIMAMMLMLGINKQLDLQTFFTASAKYFAHEQGWYAERRVYQKLFIMGIGGLGSVIMLAMLAFYFTVLKRHLFAIVGICVLIVFIVIRASSFHQVDLFLGARFLGVKVNWLLELSGIALVIYNARKLLWQKRPLIDLNELQQQQGVQ